MERNTWIPWWHVSRVWQLPAQEISPFSVTHLSVLTNALQKGRNYGYYRCFHCRNTDLRVKLHQLSIPSIHEVWKCVKAKLVQPCSPVSSGTISGNKWQGGLCQMISVQSVLLPSNLAQNQSRESWEERHGLFQGKLRIQPVQPKSSQ